MTWGIQHRSHHLAPGTSTRGRGQGGLRDLWAHGGLLALPPTLPPPQSHAQHSDFLWPLPRAVGPTWKGPGPEVVFRAIFLEPNVSASQAQLLSWEALRDRPHTCSPSSPQPPLRNFTGQSPGGGGSHLTPEGAEAQKGQACGRKPHSVLMTAGRTPSLTSTQCHNRAALLGI